MTVYRCGTEVSLKRSSYNGVITAIHVRDNTYVAYSVCYWENDTYKEGLFSDYEFTPTGGCIGVEKTTIGFIKDCNNDKTNVEGV